MAVTWCRSAAKLRALTCCHRVQGCVLLSNKEINNTGSCPRGTRGVTQYVQQTTASVNKVKYLKELYNRRMEVGPESEQHPSKYGCWNKEAENYAFGQRLGEEFDAKWLRIAFRCSSLRAVELERYEDLGISIDSIVGDNTTLAEQGEEVATKYIAAYLRFSFPELFEEGIQAVCDFLMSDETLLFLAKNFGLTYLIESNVFPPVDEDYKTTFLAVIGALLQSQGEEQVKWFVLDFIVPQLVNKNINELWKVDNPIGVVEGILKDQGRGSPEARLLSASAKNTVMALYHVGIYSDKKLIGKSPGETPLIAEEMAARNALEKILNLGESRHPLLLGDAVRGLELNTDKVNRSVRDVLKLGNRTRAMIGD